ncbi:MAG: preprotein translocase subunit SecY [Deltaproteobacteria bacterium]|nr:preprotein translocase subunit SecY [Deltaproteobacteria bacterium]
MASSIANITRLPELRSRLFFTLLMLGIYRLGVFVPTPGINPKALTDLVGKGTVFDIINMFSGGAFERLSVFALGIMPYITASIIFQLLTVAVPALEKLSKEGDAGRKRITQLTRYGTVLICLIQGFGISFGLEQQKVLLPGVGGWSYYLLTVTTLTAGTCFLMWLGEQITERGIGNGISLIIFGGIVTGIPQALQDSIATQGQFGGAFGLIFLAAFVFGVSYIILFFERGQRRIPIQYAKRVVGRKIFGAQSSHLPLKLNMAGVIPAIFASSLIMFPATMASFWDNNIVRNIAGNLTSGPLHLALFGGLIIFFCYFYTAVTLNPSNMAENIQKNGGYIPGIRPGKATAEFIDRVLIRTTLIGGLYITGICLLPQILTAYFRIPSSIATTFGGTSVLIMIGVAMDTVSQIEAHLMSRNYDGFLGAKVGRFKGRRG